MHSDLGSGLNMARDAEARLTLSQVRAVALPSRLRILRCLAKQRATVTEVSKRTGIPKTSALKHLRVLGTPRRQIGLGGYGLDVLEHLPLRGTRNA